MAQSGSAVQKEPAPRKGRKYFTLTEANRALTLVKRIVADIRDANSRRLRLHAQMSADLSSMAAERQEALQASFNQESDRVDELVDELARVGVELKDRTRGLIDFPSLHEGREVLLCWEGGEDKIHYWHEIDAGYAGRRPVSELHDAA